MTATSPAVDRRHFDWFISHFRVAKLSKGGTQALFHCPAHDDQHPSGCADFIDGEIRMICRAGCSNDSILQAVGLTSRAFYVRDDDDWQPQFIPPPRTDRGDWGKPTATWCYRNSDGSLFGEVERYDPPGGRKQIIPHHFVEGRRIRGKGPNPWPLYRADRLRDLKHGTRLYLPAGEKCVDAVEKLGLLATTHQGGENVWEPRYADELAHFDVVVLEDNDQAGRTWGARVAADIHAAGGNVRIVRFPELPEKGDVFDWIALGHGADELEALADSTRVYEAPRPETESPAIQTNAPTKQEPPVLHPKALEGLAGDIVRAFDPFTEADPAAVLGSVLVSFGNCVGRSPHMWVSETRHGTNLYAVIVGATSRSRKGTSLGPATRIFRDVDPDWQLTRQIDGIGSGEGVIWAIRDPSEPKTLKNGETVVEDEGVRDKRLMINEGEFSSQLKVQGREGSTFSEVFRKGWDSPPQLRNAVKRSPVVASDPHISMVGHVTAEEVTRELTETDKANGVGNRICWIFARRSKYLPDAPRLDEMTVQGLVSRMKTAVQHARSVGEMKRSPDAAKLWAEIYPDLSKDYPGMFGALTARAEAQVLRLSMIYSLLDCSRVIEVQHLTSALACWRYCEESARFIFGDRLGDPVADRIREALRSTGPMRETDIHDLFGRNQKGGRIGRALELLLTHGLVTVEVQSTGGRPARTWRAK